MMNDTVREELQSKIAPVSEVINVGIKAAPALRAAPVRIETPVAAKPVVPRIDTASLAIKKTSPTLVEFQTKNAALPDWRLQLQNSVRQRNSGAQRNEASVDAAPVYQKQIVTNGANALITEFVEEANPVVHENLKVANALKRIEESRRVFLTEENKEIKTAPAAKTAVNRNYPFNVVSRSDELPPRRSTACEPIPAAPKPKLVSSLRIEKKGFDTNKLPPIPQPARIVTSFDSAEPKFAENRQELLRDETSHRIQIKEKPVEPEIMEAVEIEVDEEIDDLAPLSMRFNAGLFDLILGGFSSLILISPFLLTREGWMSLMGFFAFAAVLSIVMFIYLTVSISYAGRTFGMRIFSLELVDADENAYPTLHQAAVSSSVYLLSLAAGGIGFLPILFNEEKRAAHDIVSGTILVKEFD